MSSYRSLLFVFLCWASPALSIPRPDDPFVQASSLLRKARGITTVNVTLITTTTLSSVTSTVLSTKKICGVLASGVTINGITTMTTTPAVTCRRRRSFWDEPVFIALGNDPEELQFRQLTPSQIRRFEPTMMVPEFRRKSSSNSNRKKVSVGPAMINLAPSFQSVFDRNFGHLREAEPIYFFALSSLFSTWMTNMLTSTSTFTSTVTAYTSTSTSTTFTATSSYYVAGACYPSGLTTC